LQTAKNPTSTKNLRHIQAQDIPGISLKTFYPFKKYHLRMRSFYKSIIKATLTKTRVSLKQTRSRL
jgi:hypothetical protein